MFTDSKTNRGFELVKFQDKNGNECSLQISSALAFENEDGSCDDPLGWIWLGVDDAKPEILRSKARELGLPNSEGNGWMPYPIPEDVSLHTRMHLNEFQVRELILRLNKWLKTGSINKE
jgi:hypothetical protein